MTGFLRRSPRLAVATLLAANIAAVVGPTAAIYYVGWKPGIEAREQRSKVLEGVIERLAAENARCRSGALPSAEWEDWCMDWQDWCVEKLETCEATLDLDAALDELEDAALEATP